MKALEPGSFLFSLYSAFGQLGMIGFLLILLFIARPFPQAAFAALGLAIGFSNILFAVANGFLNAQDAFVSWSIGGNERRKAETWFLHFVWLAFAGSSLLTALMIISTIWLPSYFSGPALKHADHFFTGLAYSLPLQVIFQCYRTYFQALGRPQLPTFILWAGNFALALAGWIKFKNLAAMSHPDQLLCWLVFISRVTMLLGIACFAGPAHCKTLFDYRLLTGRQCKRVLQLAMPSATQMLLEGGVFFLLFAFAANLGQQALALQSVLANIVNFVYAIPYGLSLSSATAVGRSVGAHACDAALSTGWKMIRTTFWTMFALSASWMAAGPKTLEFFFLQNPKLPLLTLCLIVGCFQLADGLQVVITGLLRGFGDTTTSLWANALGHWLVGLPLAYLLGFHFGFGIAGLWTGMATGFVVVSLVLLTKWAQLDGALRSSGSSHSRAPLGVKF